VFKDLLNTTNFQKSLFIMVAGIIGVFLVLIIFYVLIKVIARLFPEKKNK
jgi:Na+-transporting methylmalonyl-CoA/oxaloacetate decarboxylase gamma subunit